MVVVAVNQTTARQPFFLFASEKTGKQPQKQKEKENKRRQPRSLFLDSDLCIKKMRVFARIFFHVFSLDIARDIV